MTDITNDDPHDAYIDVPPEVILGALRYAKEHKRVFGPALPPDAIALRCGITENGSVRLIFRSPQLPETVAGHPRAAS